MSAFSDKLKEFFEKVGDALKDPFQQDTLTYTGTITGVIKDGQVDWKGIMAAVAVEDEAKVKLAVASKTQFDGDNFFYMSNDPSLQAMMPSLLTEHRAMVESGVAIRARREEMLLQLLKLFPKWPL